METLPAKIIGSPEGSTSHVVFLHGFMGSADDWKPIASQLAVRSISIDLPGHGKALYEEDEHYQWDSTVQCLIRTITAHTQNPVTLIGYSMGGRLATAVALSRKVPIHKLILISSSPGLPSDDERESRKENDSLLAKKIINTPLPIFIQQWYSQPLFKQNEIHSMNESRLSNSPRHLAKAIKGLSVARQPDYTSQLEEASFPTTYICGELDSKYLKIGQKLKKTKLIVVADAGHSVHTDRPQQLTKILQEEIA